MQAATNVKPMPIPGAEAHKSAFRLFKEKLVFKRASSTASSDASHASPPTLINPSPPASEHSSQPGSYFTIDEVDGHILDWSRRGFETLPDDPAYRLISLWSTPASSLYSLARSAASSSSSLASVSSNYGAHGRFIPALVSYRIEWTGRVPLKQSTFDLSHLAPALLQEGEYNVNLKWMSETTGEFMPMAATKDIAVKTKSHVLARSYGVSSVKFSKQHGPASISVTKEGWMYRAKDRPHEVRVVLDYVAPLELSLWSSSSDLTSSPWTSPALSRRSSMGSLPSGRGSADRASSVPSLPTIPASPAVVVREGGVEADESSASVPLDELQRRNTQLLLKTT